MPIVRINEKLVFFAHVPKCAGTAVERYLEERFGPLGLHDPAFGRRSPIEAWTLSPPQHIPEPVRRELLPDGLFDALFAIVRHPALRLRSVFLFQREVEKALPPKMGFGKWLATLPRTLALDPYALHGHLRPMAEIVPESARVFRLEDGLGDVVSWLDGIAGTTDGPREIGQANVLATRVPGGDVPDIALTPAICNRIAELYPQDYTRFGYSVMPGDEGIAA
ncbi:sulfotransferase family protein [Marimonas lutisalis]|uniref:sulfotransferase family protein n=1 Tax=Marimonas lutisalis TaxID=2545756 RepID=UPI0010F91AFA|nr:sulfotransferase family protein [Marimonas lutisalis]